jgi:hypothetical protein
VERGGEGAALLTELRLPTGDEANLLGAGEPSFKVAFLGAMNTIGEASLHTNGGYTVGGLSDEIVFAAGIDGPVLAQQRVTASLSFLGRSLREAALPERVATVRRVVNTGPTGERSIVVDRFFWSQDQLSFFQLAAGAKVNLGGDWLLSGTVLIPLNRTGFQPGITPAVGIERKWGDPQ